MSHDLRAQLASNLTDRYEIDREIGRGGMATVFLARDVKHDRQVALKVLDPELGAVLGAERFLAEIKVTANLQHPNLLPLFDSGESAGLLFYVMPFVEGESLRARLEREKQLPVDEAIRISVAIANALEYAHAHGVIHRDLKPENILMQHGQPVIADFGIALAVSKAGGARITQTGLSLGTPQYMSPEQATGDRVIDGRSDIYSLAAMTYEMLAGEPPHSGTTAQAIIARVLTDKPRSLRSTRAAVPEYVEAAIEHALEKLPADRFASAREFADALQGRGAMGMAGTSQRTQAMHAAAARGWRSRLSDPVLVVLGVVAIGASAAALMFARRASGTPAGLDHTIRFVVAATDSVQPDGSLYPWPAAISPDGSMIVYKGKRDGKTMLYLLRTDRIEPRPIPGTENAFEPAFSPDGQWIVFGETGLEKKVRLDGSAPVKITDGGAANGIDWTAHDELILGAQGTTHGLTRVSVTGGDLQPLTRVDSAKGAFEHLWPVTSADAKYVVFTIWHGAQPSAELAVAAIADGVVAPLGIKALRPLALLDGALLYVKMDGSVMAVPVDLAGRKVTGNPVSVHDPVQVNAGNNGNSGIFVSRGGALVTTRGSTTGQLSWLARDGSVRSISPDIRTFDRPRLSPDGRRIAVGVLGSDATKADVWIFDLGNSTLSRLTSLETVNGFEWTRDGSALIVTSTDASTRFAIWSQPMSGAAPPTKLAELDELTFSGVLAPDGSALLTSVLHNSTWSVMRVPLTPAGGGKPEIFLDSKGTDWGPRFSPDGRWVAITSDESSRTEVYIRSYPEPGVRVQVTDAGGGSPKWAPDGKSLYYHSGSDIVQAKLEFTPSPRIVSRDVAFHNVNDYDTPDFGFAGFDLTADGSKAVVVRPTSNTFRLVVSPNWLIEFRQRMAEANKKQ